MLKELIKLNPAAVDESDKDGMTPLLRAATSGCIVDIIFILLKSSPQSIEQRDPNDRTFLHLLSEFLPNYYLDVKVMELLETYPKVDQQRMFQDKEGNTPLHHAIIHDNWKAVNILAKRCHHANGHEYTLVNYKGEDLESLLQSRDAPAQVDQRIMKLLKSTPHQVKGLHGIRAGEINNYVEALLVVATLLATITFAAAFQVPGGFESETGSPVLVRQLAYKFFMVFDVIAICGSMFVLVCLLYVMESGKHEAVRLLDLSVFTLEMSSYATFLAFLTGAYVTLIQPNSSEAGADAKQTPPPPPPHSESSKDYYVKWLAQFALLFCLSVILVLIMLRRKVFLFLAKIVTAVENWNSEYGLRTTWTYLSDKCDGMLKKRS